MKTDQLIYMHQKDLSKIEYKGNNTEKAHKYVEAKLAKNYVKY